MNEARKFLFETNFDGEDGDASSSDASRQPEAPSFSEADLEQARDEGFAAGREQGMKDAAATIDHTTARALELITAQMQDLIPALTQDSERRNAEALQAAMGVVRKLFPIFTKTQAVTEIEGLISRCLEHLREEPRVAIRVCDDLLNTLHRRLGDLVTRCGYEGKIVMLADETLLPGDVRVEWADGGAERDSEALWREVDEIVSRAVRLGGPAPAPTGASETAELSANSSTDSPTSGTAPNGEATTRHPEPEATNGDATTDDVTDGDAVNGAIGTNMETTVKTAGKSRSPKEIPATAQPA